MLNIRKNTATFLVLFGLFSSCAIAVQDYTQIDNLRAELALQKDKSSSSYIKSKEKLKKLIKQTGMDYSSKTRIEEAKRLISEKKYNAAIFELNDLIDDNMATSTANELLGDLYFKISKDANKSSKYYKKALEGNPKNLSAELKLAKLYINSERNIAAIEYLKNIVEDSTDTTYFKEVEDILLNKITPRNNYEYNNIYEVLGLLNFKVGRTIEAYKYFAKALESNPRDICLRYQFANLLNENNDNKNALILYNTILREHPEDSQIRLLRAKILLSFGYTNEAYEEFKTVLKQYPKSNQAKYGIYQIYKNQLSPDEIILKFHDNDPLYHVSKDEIEAFVLFLSEIKDFEGAKKFSEYLTREKQTKELYKNVEQTDKIKKQEKLNYQLEKVKKIELTEPDCEETVNKNPQKEEKKDIKKIEPKIQKQKVELKKDDKKQQITIVNKDKKEKLELENPKKNNQTELEREIEQKRLEEKKLIARVENQKKFDNSALEKEVAASQKNPKYNQYKATIEKYLKTNPINANAYIAAANTYKQASMPYSAIKYYNEAKKLEPLNSEIYYNLGLTYMELNRLDESKENLEKSINLDKDNKKAQTLLSFVNQKITTSIINKAYADFEKKKYIESYTTLDSGIKKIPNNAQLYYYRALVSEAMNRNAASIMDLQKAIEIDPGYYMAYYYLGKGYEKIKDFKSALVAYERFLSIEPDEKELVEEIQKKVEILGQKYY